MSDNNGFNDNQKAFDPLKGVRILVVDGEKNSRNYIRYSFSRLSLAEVHTANHGHAAWDQLLQARQDDQKFDLIILDSHMPEMDGATFLKHMEESGHFPIHRIVLITKCMLHFIENQIYRYSLGGMVHRPFTGTDVVFEASAAHTRAKEIDFEAKGK